MQRESLNSSTICSLSVVVLAAGSAGPVASTHQTLGEVERRIAINATNTPGDNDATPSLFKITQPGSYYLTGNITGVAGEHGIEIVATRGLSCHRSRRVRVALGSGCGDMDPR